MSLQMFCRPKRKFISCCVTLIGAATTESRGEVLTLFCCCSLISRSPSKPLEKKLKSCSRVCISSKTLRGTVRKKWLHNKTDHLDTLLRIKDESARRVMGDKHVTLYSVITEQHRLLLQSSRSSVQKETKKMVLDP